MTIRGDEIQDTAAGQLRRQGVRVHLDRIAAEAVSPIVVPDLSLMGHHLGAERFVNELTRTLVVSEEDVSALVEGEAGGLLRAAVPSGVGLLLENLAFAGKVVGGAETG